jgi:hypothetical protein
MRTRSTAGLTLTTLATMGIAAAIEAAVRPRSTVGTAMAKPPAVNQGVTRAPDQERLRAVTRLHGASALLAVAALADSATEHYRGSFHNKTMILPLVTAAETLAASLHGMNDHTSEPRVARHFAHAQAVATGVAGTGFHFYNVTKRPGGWSWLNLFYAAPLGAPAALSLAGALGGIAERLRGDSALFGFRPGTLIARLVSLGLLGSSAEAALLHFRGAFHNPAMVLPVTAPPLAAVLLTGATINPRLARPASLVLRALAGIGLLGTAFHAYGIQREMGGLRNWSQNLLNGPPLPAPPAFTALAIAGLAALKLREDEG